ncbi:MMPL family transporter [Nitriliruptoraceae bacterium ZYF776]|nr:MMPL family transporter [Profundirhabdus halotolerans]
MPRAVASSYGLAVVPQVEQFGDLDDVSRRVLDAAVQDAFDGPQGDQLLGLLSDDPRETRPRAGLVVVTFERDADDAAITTAATALEDALDREDLGILQVDPFSFQLLTEEIEASFEEELPLLLGISFLLIVLILSVMFRTFSDVALGVVGLLASLVWMAGLAVLLGPDWLGLTGPFSQIAIAVPVLLVGLGVDYSVHLSSRYREERAGGAAPPAAARAAIGTVGAALTLATATTVIGFLSNLVSPLPPIADFGVFAAAGILAAFVLLGLVVPAGRTLVDRRRGGGGSGTDDAGPAAPGGGRVIAAVGTVPARAPVLAILVGATAATAFGLLGLDIDTSFDQEEFLPDDADAARVLDRLDQLFGGDVSERTEVLVTGEVRRAETLRALDQAERDLAEVEQVVSAAGRAEVRSVAASLGQLHQQVEATRTQLAAQFLLFEDPEAALDELPLPETITAEDLPPDVRDGFDDGELDGGAEGLPVDDLDALDARLPEGVTAADALLGALPDADLTAAFREELAAQLTEESPELDAAARTALAGLAADEVTLSRLEELGYPLDELPEDAREALELGDELEAAGWDADGPSEDADVAALLDVLDREVGDELAGVLVDDAALLSISTRGADEDPEGVAAAIEEQLQPLTDAGLEVTVVSQPLLLEETLQALTDSQTEAIGVTLGAALLLLLLYYGITERRPALGAITMVPSLLALPLIVGTMVLVGLGFNALTVTVASISIGIGVPYGIHLTNRYLESRRRFPTPEEAVRDTVRHTGGALAGSAITTAVGFGVLLLSDLEPIEQFGAVTAITIGFTLVTALLVETSALVLWDRHHRRRGRAPQAPAEAGRVPEEVPA